MTLSSLLNFRIALFVLAGILAVFGVGNAFVAVFIPAKHELAYHYDVVVSHCQQDNCAYSAELEIANTGKEQQERVSVVIRGLPPGIAVQPRFLNLDASYPRSHDPRIRQNHDQKSLTITLEQLGPGTLVYFRVAGYMPRRQLERALEPEVKVEGRGRMVEGDPRSIAIARILS